MNAAAAFFLGVQRFRDVPRGTEDHDAETALAVTSLPKPAPQLKRRMSLAEVSAALNR
jgi:hypothetical protein